LGDASKKETSTFYFEEGKPEIPFISLKDGAGMFAPLMGYGSKSATVVIEGNTAILTSPSEETAVFDFTNNTITIHSPDQFFRTKGRASACDVYAQDLTDSTGKSAYLKDLGAVSLLQGQDVVYDLARYNIPMILENGMAYLPVETFTDLFSANLSQVFFYNGQALFLSSGQVSDNLKKLYYSAPTGPRSATLAEFTYNELCLNFDANYALKGKHNITSFDEFFTHSGRKEDLLSLDPLTANAALSYVLSTDLDDGHSSGDMGSYLAGSSFDPTEKKYNGISNAAWDTAMTRFSTVRTAALGTYKPFDIIDDTAYLTFDQFIAPTQDYYTNHPTEADAGKDTITLVGYADSQIRGNSAVKNVVIDLSCNRGGAAAACAYIASWLCDGTTITIENPLDGASASVAYSADTNFDGVYDNKDTLQGLGLHIYALTSRCSFSCGNLLPSLLKQSTKATLLGQRSGGGACVVRHSGTADGALFNMSGSKMLCTSINGTLEDIDNGVEPDHYIQDPASFYDRKALNTYLNALL
jgi:hypothetical protein